jgi:hypothetical protein
MLKIIRRQKSDCDCIELCLENKDRPGCKELVVIFHSLHKCVGGLTYPDQKKIPLFWTSYVHNVFTTVTFMNSAHFQGYTTS